MEEIMEDPSSKKTVLFVCLNAISHVNSVLSMANYLHSKGHRTVFLLSKPLPMKLRKFGHEVYDATTPDLSPSPDDDSVRNESGERMVEMCREYWQRANHIESLEFMMLRALPVAAADVRECDDNVARKVALIKPDCFVYDHFFAYPSLMKLGLPWARVYSATPLVLHHDEHLPQAWMGLPTNWDRNDPKQVDWNERAKRIRRQLYDEIVNPYYTSKGLPALPTEPVDYLPVSPHLNIYMYPEELDYEQPLINWERCDCLIRDFNVNKFELPQKLRNKPGKLILLSLGSMACAEVSLMKRLTSMLADSPHRYIVVMGPKKNEYELPDNMWGDEFLPQLDILPHLDMVITHGGNNTLTESLYHGVPGFVVCPLFGDQPDNAQRIQEMGLGIRVDPYNCTKEELQGAIEEILARPGLKERIKRISERMRRPECRERPFKLIENFVEKAAARRGAQTSVV